MAKKTEGFDKAPDSPPELFTAAQRRLAALEHREADVESFVRESEIYERGINTPEYVAKLERQLEDIKLENLKKYSRPGSQRDYATVEARKLRRGAESEVDQEAFKDRHINLKLEGLEAARWFAYCTAQGASARSLARMIINAEVDRFFAENVENED